MIQFYLEKIALHVPRKGQNWDNTCDLVQLDLPAKIVAHVIYESLCGHFCVGGQ